MNFDFGEQINPDLEKKDYSKAVSIAETALKSIPTTDFHSIIGQSLVGQAGGVANWIDNFHKTVSKVIEPRALYFEMNEFDINTDTWYIDGFAFSEDGGLNLEDMDWLSDVSQETMTTEEYVITGYENLQEAFENIELDTDEQQDARDWCEQLVIARFMELMGAAHKEAKEQNMEWAELPLYFTEHSYDFIVKSE
ncbi:hypothetical protein EFA69_13540 [Rufibacter immobilis]|uniref:DUF4303 domain-containing protein n=1 Tax=Rufibacter immobilis TaxID=1348778 RepID=A0A3M9MPN5_9BACT|nr:hypothetical protein [Rufibacter immobilis]RNI27185.1 hypothetical protein EFA69_13540 [Rufibacter immobilis]